MKRFACLILFMCLLMSGMVVPTYAQDCTVEAEVSYMDNLITVTYTNNMEHDSYIMVYMTEENSHPDAAFSTVKRVEEVFCGAGESTQLSFIIGNDLLVPGGDTETDGAWYKLWAVSGGETPVEAESESFYIFTQSEMEDILQEINDASADTIASVIYNNLVNVLGFTEVDVSAAAWKGEYAYAMRVDDYANEFKSLDDIKTVWTAIDVLNTVNSSTSETLTGNIETYTDELGITPDSYYETVSEAVSKFIPARVASDSPLSLKEFADLFNEAIAVEYLNANNDDSSGLLKLDAYFKDYQTSIGLTNDDMTAYAKKNAATFAQQFNEYDVSTKGQIVEKFRAALTAVPDSTESGSTDNEGTGNDNSSSGNASSSLGSTGGNGGGGTTYYENATEDKEEKGNRFSDVGSSFWAYEPIEALAEAGILSGYPDGSFKSNQPVTREEYTKVLVNAFSLVKNSNYEVNFIDVSPERWSSSVISTAASLSIVNGVGEDRFAPTANITRQDAAVMISRTLQSKGITLKGDSSGVSFTDEGSISDYAAEAISLLASYKVINGFEDGSFRPTGLLTRAEMAKIIYTVINLR